MTTKTTAQHTPGPHRYDNPEPDEYRVLAGDQILATLHDPYARACGAIQEVEANACLFATASDLLAALKRLGSMEAFALARAINKDDPVDIELLARIDYARAAVTKAEVGSS